jgi:hypothetical protein
MIRELFADNVPAPLLHGVILFKGKTYRAEVGFHEV